MRILQVCFLICNVAVGAAMAQDASAPARASVTNYAGPAVEESNVSSNTVTIDGTTYHDVRWGRLTPTTVTLYHSTGIATMPLATLPPDLQKKFGYDPQKAAAWDASVQKATAARQAAEQAQRAAEEKTAAAKAEADKQKALAAANSALTNAPPQKVQQNSRPSGGATVGALRQRIQRSYSQPGNQ